MNKMLALLLILLSGCTTIPKYSYQSQASNDPEFIFGDRFGGDSINSPARTFSINIKDATSNTCSDFSMVGVTSNNWLIKKPAIQLKTPSGKQVSIRGTYLLHPASCEPPTLIFAPKDGATYSVDVQATYPDPTHIYCMLSIVQKMPDGKQEQVSGITVLPSCKD